jgi:two-component system CheB/CheR fusion protein
MPDFLRELLEATSGSRLRRYGAVAGVLVLATLLRWLLDPSLGDRRPYLTYQFALMYVAWCHGVVPSAVMMFFGLLAGTYFFIPPRHSLLILDLHYWATSGETLLNGATIILLFGAMGAAHRHAASSARKALAKQGQLELEIAQRRQAEEALRRARDELEQRVRERTSALAQANEALRVADRHKDEFLAMLAHELRNPLAPLRNALQIIQQPGAYGATAERAREMAERQVGHMARLLDDLLDVSRISRGKIELRTEAVDLAAVVRRTVDAVLPLIEQRSHELTVSLPTGAVHVQGDPTRLEQIVTNLLHNAAKYTDPGGHVWLGADREGAEAVIRVRDTGVGIAPEMLPRIFDLFVQAERRLDRAVGGVGIGLTLVRRLVELHGGTVAASSPGPGRGSEFVVRLPALPAGREGEGGPTKAPPRPAKQGHPACRRLLVVDDNVDAADSLALLFKMGGREVRVAYDGPTALILARGFRPQVVLLDIGMPGMDGYEVARQLRRQAGTEGVVLIALTGWGREEDRRRSREAGFDHHVVKPVEPRVLEELIARAGPLPSGAG